MKKTTKSKSTPAVSAPLSTKPNTSSSKVTSPKVTAAAAAAIKTPVPAPAPIVKAAPAKPTTKLGTIKIKAQIDIGFGNELFIRGTNAGLSWDKGAQMNCINDNTWSFTLVGVSDPVAFKFLVNDTSWSTGEDYVARPGDEVFVVPAF